MNTHEPADPREVRGLRPEDADELLGVYVLDALDDHERAAVEQHLTAHPAARDEVARLRAALDEVVEADTVPPRPALWDAIAAQLDSPASTSPPASAVDELAARRARGQWRFPALAAAAAVLLVLAGVVIGRTSVDDRTDVAGDLREVAARVATEPGARQATLRGPGGSVDVVVDARGRAYLDASLPALADGRTYQLWSVDGTTTVSLGLLGATPSVAMVEIGAARTLAVTAEVAGGVVQSAEAPVVVGELA